MLKCPEYGSELGSRLKNQLRKASIDRRNK